MSTIREYWIITVANPYCDLFLRGLKTMELRKRTKKEGGEE